MSWPVVYNMCFATEYSLECWPKFWTENGVNDGIQGGIKIPHPQKERNKGVVELVVLKNGHN